MYVCGVCVRVYVYIYVYICVYGTCINIYLNNTLQTTKNNVAISLILSARYE